MTITTVAGKKGWFLRGRDEDGVRRNTTQRLVRLGQKMQAPSSPALEKRNDQTHQNKNQRRRC